VRGKVVVELGVVSVLTTIFLLLFPKHNPLLDVALAGFALVCIVFSALYTKKVIWAASPPPVAEHRFKRCVVVTLLNTFPRTANYSHHFTNQIGRGVRNSDAVSDSRAHRGFALCDAHRDCFPVLGLDLVNGHEMVDQLINDWIPGSSYGPRAASWSSTNSGSMLTGSSG